MGARRKKKINLLPFSSSNLGNDKEQKVVKEEKKNTSLSSVLQQAFNGTTGTSLRPHHVHQGQDFSAPQDGGQVLPVLLHCLLLVLVLQGDFRTEHLRRPLPHGHGRGRGILLLGLARRKKRRRQEAERQGQQDMKRNYMM